jgi:hypothetical protein
MEQRPHVPGYGKEELSGRDLDREMTMEELDAMEVEPIIVEKKGVVSSKVESQRPRTPSEEEHFKQMILNQIDAEMMRPIRTDIEKRVRDIKVQKLRDKMGGVGHIGHA